MNSERVEDVIRAASVSQHRNWMGNFIPRPPFAARVEIVRLLVFVEQCHTKTNENRTHPTKHWWKEIGQLVGKTWPPLDIHSSEPSEHGRTIGQGLRLMDHTGRSMIIQPEYATAFTVWFSSFFLSVLFPSKLDIKMVLFFFSNSSKGLVSSLFYNNQDIL